jgi:hypothetical protein
MKWMHAALLFVACISGEAATAQAIQPTIWVVGTVSGAVETGAALTFDLSESNSCGGRTFKVLSSHAAYAEIKAATLSVQQSGGRLSVQYATCSAGVASIKNAFRN